MTFGASLPWGYPERKDGEGSMQFEEMRIGMSLMRCRKCGCMHDTLEALLRQGEHPELVETWTSLLEPREYDCLGCQHCYSAEATRDMPDLVLNCDFEVTPEPNFPVPGDYVILDVNAPIAISTLTSLDLKQAIIKAELENLNVVGKTETENIGIDKIVKNMLSNPALKFLILAGEDAPGHLPGQTLLALSEHGVDSEGRVIDSPGKRPILRNVCLEEIEAFRMQVEVIDMIGCIDVMEISARMQRASANISNSVQPGRGAATNCGCSSSEVPVIHAESPATISLDEAGYFVIFPRQGVIIVEHYAYDNTLLHLIEGTTARDIFSTIINKGWVTELSHAAYLGKELSRAEIALEHGWTYVQDGA
jgi:tetrahydromethanopterin S-methyltransferase subunit A